ncbi:hypothetical protein LguiB_029978 [Lonicera macranthoides]
MIIIIIIESGVSQKDKKKRKRWDFNNNKVEVGGFSNNKVEVGFYLFQYHKTSILPPFLNPIIKVLVAEQDHNSQIGSTLCLASAIEGSVEAVEE